MTLTPRSWPSRPTLAVRILIFRVEDGAAVASMTFLMLEPEGVRLIAREGRDRCFGEMVCNAEGAVRMRKMVAVDPGYRSDAVSSSDQRTREACCDSRSAGRGGEHVVERVGGREGADGALEGEAGVRIGDVHRWSLVDHAEPVEQRHRGVLEQRLTNSDQ